MRSIQSEGHGWEHGHGWCTNGQSRWSEACKLSLLLEDGVPAWRSLQDECMAIIERCSSFFGSWQSCLPAFDFPWSVVCLCSSWTRTFLELGTCIISVWSEYAPLDPNSVLGNELQEECHVLTDIEWPLKFNLGSSCRVIKFGRKNCVATFLRWVVNSRISVFVSTKVSNIVMEISIFLLSYSSIEILHVLSNKGSFVLGTSIKKGHKSYLLSVKKLLIWPAHFHCNSKLLIVIPYSVGPFSWKTLFLFIGYRNLALQNWNL